MAEELLQEIDAFLEANPGMSATAFGKQAVNDGKFISNVRDGRRVWPETAERVRKFMREYAPPEATERSVQRAGAR